MRDERDAAVVEPWRGASDALAEARRRELRDMTDEQALEAVEQLPRLGFCFIGGLTVLRWGEPRLTRDVGLTILAPYGVEAPVVDELLTRFAPRIADARVFALENRVLLVAASNDVPIDIALGDSSSRHAPWSGHRCGASETRRC